LKFTPKDGRVEIRLSISTEFPVLRSQCVAEAAQAPQNLALIQVSDTGSGISPDFLPHVFDRFRQADGSITRSQGGLGLGLAIVRHLVEMHGGSVHAESLGVGQGATFTVYLPLIDTRKTPEEEAQKAGEGETSKELSDAKLTTDYTTKSENTSCNAG
ncbi:MAG: sensor histidine kinase, partial [Brasilonema sp.]